MEDGKWKMVDPFARENCWDLRSALARGFDLTQRAQR
jgi:hypothetical protein